MPSSPRLGALGHAFTAVRAMQFASLVAIIGMTANFISEINGADATPPPVLVGTLVISCIATLYIVLSYILYYDSLLPLLLAAGADTLLLVAVIVVACLLGKPLSHLSCEALPKSGSTAAFMASVTSNITNSQTLSYLVWVGAHQKTCYAVKAVWGLSVALCVLFAFSAVVTGRNKSLGTAVLKEKRFDGSDSDSDSCAPQRPWFPPPPTAYVTSKRRVEIVQPARLPVQPLPVLPQMVVTPAPASPVEHLVHRKPLARGKSKRKTIMEFIDGWWDLGLLEQQKRENRLAREASRKAQPRGVLVGGVC
ncbi:hypothetical protein CMUS01_09995 [Colletotrichum musicola]|uniref:MARVEL domain-containing protein n=1 Tax=Colletotrichum musicola TaxID=2175873 RepID=A0A8H6K695_9PEZI|nr:hypothetical protein CMUS01_09995 [Colletotrichum musicola]